MTVIAVIDTPKAIRTTHSRQLHAIAVKCAMVVRLAMNDGLGESIKWIKIYAVRYVWHTDALNGNIPQN